MFKQTNLYRRKAIDLDFNAGVRENFDLTQCYDQLFFKNPLNQMIS